MTDRNFLETFKTKSSPNKNIIGIIVLIIVLLVGGFFVFKNRIAREPEGEKQEFKNVALPQVARISEDNLQKEMPEGFLESIPLNGKTKVIESYSVTYPNSTAKQATVIFQSSKTLKENKTFYEKWAKDNKWQINKAEQNKIVSFNFVKDNAFLTISLEELLNNTAKVTIVYKPTVVSGFNEMKEQLRNINL